MRNLFYASCWWLHLAIRYKFRQDVDIKQCQDLLPNDWRKELLSVGEALAKEVLVDTGNDYQKKKTILKKFEVSTNHSIKEYSLK